MYSVATMSVRFGHKIFYYLRCLWTDCPCSNLIQRGGEKKLTSLRTQLFTIALASETENITGKALHMYIAGGDPHPP